MLYALVPALLTLLTIGRRYRPRAARVPGVLVREHPLPLLSRLRLYAWPAAGVVVTGIAGLALDWLPGWVLAALLTVVIAVILAPVRYTLTTEAIVCGRTSPRRWTEFAGVARRSGGARLQGIGDGRGLSVWLVGSHDIDETVLLLRRLVRGSYQGRSAPAATADAATGPEPTPGLLELAPIAARQRGAVAPLSPGRPGAHPASSSSASIAALAIWAASMPTWS